MKKNDHLNGIAIHPARKCDTCVFKNKDCHKLELVGGDKICVLPRTASIISSMLLVPEEERDMTVNDILKKYEDKSSQEREERSK